MSTSDPAAGKPRVPMWALAAAAVAVLALAVIVVFVLPDDGPPTATPSSPGAAPSAGTPTSPPAENGTATAIPTAAPGEVTWQLVGQVAVPFSATDGPAHASATRATGFARTPVGALIAAAQISTRSGYSAGRESWESAVRNQFVASADRDALLAILRDAAASGQQPAAPGELSQIAGFRYLSYTADTAVVGLVRRTPQGSHAMTTLTVRWAAGDWKLLAPAAGQWPSATSTLSNLSGVIAWGPS